MISNKYHFYLAKNKKLQKFKKFLLTILKINIIIENVFMRKQFKHMNAKKTQKKLKKVLDIKNIFCYNE